MQGVNNMACCSNSGCDIVAYLHTSIENKRDLFSVYLFLLGKIVLTLLTMTNLKEFLQRKDRKRQLAGVIEFIIIFESKKRHSLTGTNKNHTSVRMMPISKEHLRKQLLFAIILQTTNMKELC